MIQMECTAVPEHMRGDVSRHLVRIFPGQCRIFINKPGNVVIRHAASGAMQLCIEKRRCVVRRIKPKTLNVALEMQLCFRHYGHSPDILPFSMDNDIWGGVFDYDIRRMEISLDGIAYEDTWEESIPANGHLGGGNGDLCRKSGLRGLWDNYIILWQRSGNCKEIVPDYRNRE